LDGVPPIGYWLLARLLDATYAGAYEEALRRRNIDPPRIDTAGRVKVFERDKASEQDPMEYAEPTIPEYTSLGLHPSREATVRDKTPIIPITTTHNNNPINTVRFNLIFLYFVYTLKNLQTYYSFHHRNRNPNQNYTIPMIQKVCKGTIFF
jgi:hypothetical protein